MCGHECKTVPSLIVHVKILIAQSNHPFWLLNPIVCSRQGVDYGAIIFGVGSNRIQLPIPSGCPGGLKMLLEMCWCACKCGGIYTCLWWFLVGVVLAVWLLLNYLINTVLLFSFVDTVFYSHQIRTLKKTFEKVYKLVECEISQLYAVFLSFTNAIIVIASCVVLGSDSCHC